MQFIVALLAIAGVAAAAATPQRRAPADVCGPLDTPLCCQTDVAGFADFDCSAVPSTVTTTEGFVAFCAAKGLTAECCVSSLFGQEAFFCSAVSTE